MSNETMNAERYREWAEKIEDGLSRQWWVGTTQVCRSPTREERIGRIAAVLADLEPAPVVYDTDDIAAKLIWLYKDNEENATTSDLAIAMSNKLKELLVGYVAPVDPPKGLVDAVTDVLMEYSVATLSLTHSIVDAVQPLFDEQRSIFRHVNGKHHDEIHKLKLDNDTLVERFGPEIVCLCGSGRFKGAFQEAEFNETVAGHIVLTIGCNTKDVARSESLNHLKPALDELHKRKIDLCDRVHILNVGGYIGDSTRSEIEYAQALKRPITYLEADDGK